MNSRHLPAGILLGLNLGLLTCLPGVAAADDDVRVNQIMMDVQDLQRTVRDQARRIDELERAYRQAGVPSSSADGKRPLEPPDDKWLQMKNWERVKQGMTAQEVIAILGMPASMRTDPNNANAKTLFYAKQIGASGFLGGSVVFENDRARQISRPVLK